MDTNEAKAHADKRYKELTKEFPNFNEEYKVNLIIKELRVKYDFDTLVFSAQHNGHLRVKEVKFPCAANGDIMTFNIY